MQLSNRIAKSAHDENSSIISSINRILLEEKCGK
jgi:hypothetical protein